MSAHASHMFSRHSKDFTTPVFSSSLYYLNTVLKADRYAHITLLVFFLVLEDGHDHIPSEILGQLREQLASTTACVWSYL
jgi:hypothetical protein